MRRLRQGSRGGAPASRRRYFACHHANRMAAVAMTMRIPIAARLPTLALATVILALAADGGAPAPHAPEGPVTARPPLTAQAATQTLRTRTAGSDARRLLAGLARAFVESPADVTVAAGLLEAARGAGRMDWLDAFVSAASRRQRTPALLFLRAEIAYAEGGYLAGIDLARAAHTAAPVSPEIGASYSAALAATDGILEAFGVVSRWVAEPAAWPGLDDATLQRLTVFASAVAPRSLGDRASTVWLTETWRSRDPAARTRALAFASSLAESLEQTELAEAMAAQSLHGAARSAPAGAAAIAVMNAADVADDGGLVGRIGGVCHALPSSRGPARDDCLVSALERSVVAGALDRAAAFYRILRGVQHDSPVLALRFAHAAIPLLELTGDFRAALDLASRAAVAAEALGNKELETSFRLRLARARRLAGDYPGARREALRVVEQIEQGPLDDSMRERAVAEATKALRGIHGGIGLAGREHPEPVVTAVADVDTVGPGEAAVSPPRVLAVIERADGLEAAGRTVEALTAYTDAQRMLAGMQQRGSMDLLQSIAVSDVWREVDRRALRLALAGGRVGLALSILERGRVPRSAIERQAELASLDLPRRSALIAYALAPQRTWAIVSRDGGVRLVELPVGTVELRDRVTLWRELSKGNHTGARRGMLTDALAETLFDPVEATGLLDGTDVVYVVPDDVLHLLPFGALAAEGSSRAAGLGRTEGPASGRTEGPARARSKRLIVQAPSLDSLRRSLAASPADGPLVAFGPAGGAGTLAELQAVRRSGGFVFVGRRATETEWRRQSKVAGALHFGGHSTPVEATVATAALQLTGDAAADGRLTIAEILASPLPGSTVVLLGCDTATRPEEPWPAAYYRQTPSLGEAFLHAGARAVVGHLWPITEEDAQLFAVEFYRAGGPRRGAAALEESRAVLRARFPDLPRRWAGAVWLGAAGLPQDGGRNQRMAETTTPGG